MRNGTPEMQDGKPILVLGGTGKTGRRVVQRLIAQGLPVRVGSRSAQPPFDWNDSIAGDDDQALYGFKGSSAKFIRRSRRRTSQPV
jgi:nucleoside-diphosphate-sugar epimerase